MVEEGLLGRPLDIEARLITSQVGPGLRDAANFRYTDAEQGGGILHMEGCLHLDVMRYLMGCEVKSVQAMTGRPVGHIEAPLEDIALAAFEFENGAFGSIHVGFLQSALGGYDTDLVFRGTQGEAHWRPVGSPSLEVTSDSPGWRHARSHTFDYDFEPIPRPGYGTHLWQPEILQRFVDGIRQDREPEVTVDDALHVLQLIEAVYESSRTGRRVEVSYGV